MKRRLVVCADGTWNTADESSGGVRTPTNVIKLARAIMPVAKDGTSQIIHYHEGVGSHPDIERVLGGAFGKGINRNICDCYRFLIHNYAQGDEIFLFGFSRGAYTVRSLAGLVRNSGLLSLEHEDRIPDAFELYRDRTDHSGPNAPRSKQFRTEFSREVRIKCLGVWDTVGSLGVPVEGLNRLDRQQYEFHDVRLSSWIDNAFQALAIDERRGPFLPAVWEQQPQAKQRLEQVWFAGVHANVGGGYADTGLSDIALLWMIDRAEECGLEFHRKFLDRSTRAAFDGELRDSMTPLYQLLMPLVREIASPRFDEGGNTINTYESVHPSALQRYATIVSPPQGPYRPANLTAYMDRHPKPEPATSPEGSIRKRTRKRTPATSGAGKGPPARSRRGKG